jgi:four helix bundle protein
LEEKVVIKNLGERLLLFAVDVIKFLQKIPKTVEYDVIRYQLAKSGSSIGANYEESQAASSTADFYHKISISLKETRETYYWLKIIDSLNIGDQKERIRLKNESEELMKILGSICLKYKKKL